MTRKYLERWPGGSAGSQLWIRDFLPVPRTCSFCGGINPEDAIRLMGQGWEDDPTGKSYKCYLGPPGSDEHLRKSLSSARAEAESGGDWSEGYSRPSAAYVLHGPPVKVYFMHFTDGQLAEFNRLVKARRQKGS